MQLLMAALPALISAGAGGVSALAGRGSQKQTPDMKRKSQLIDQLLKSVQGSGPYSPLFNMDNEGYQRSYVNPMMSQFQNQIAPMIQQSFIGSGQQRGTGLEDALSRAGVEMNQLLGQQYASMSQAANQNKLGMLGQILQTDTGQPAPQQSAFRTFLQGVGGGMATPGFGEGIGNVFQTGMNMMNRPPQSTGGNAPAAGAYGNRAPGTYQTGNQGIPMRKTPKGYEFE